MNKLLLLFFTIIGIIPNFAQDTTAYTEMSYDEMVKRIYASRGKISFVNKKFFINAPSKFIRTTAKQKKYYYKVIIKNKEKLERIEFNNCKFEGYVKGQKTEIDIHINTKTPVVFKNVSFEQKISIESQEEGEILLQNCSFIAPISIVAKKKKVFIEKMLLPPSQITMAEGIFSSKVKGINTIEANYLKVSSTHLPNFLFLKGTKGLVLSNVDIFKDTTFLSTVFLYGKSIYIEKLSSDFSILFNCNELLIIDSKCEDELEISEFRNEALKSVSIINSKINVIDIENCAIEEKFLIDSTKIEILGLSHTKLPTDNMDLPFDLIKDGKVSVLGKPKTPYNLNTMDTLYNASINRSLASIYQKLLNGYKTNGDKKSFNQCYVEYKTFETKTLMQDYKINPSFELWFQIQLNKFLRIFSAYGTSPARAMIYSFWVILVFSLIYFVFPSEEDNLTKQRLQKRFDRLINYFTSEKGLSEIEIEEKIHIISEIEKFKYNYENLKKEIPWLLSKLGKPIYLLSLTYFKISLWFLNQIDISNGVWKELPPKRRLFGNILIIFYFLIYIFWGILIRTLNSLTLSMNAFVTLGFGELQARGISRYFAIAEGLIGWFLLSIFSVSLISQVLQL